MKIVISKETKNFMRYAKRISEIEGRETGFLLHYFHLPNNNNDCLDVFHTEMVIGDKAFIRIRSKYQNFLSGLENKIELCGSFHVHPYRKYLNSYKEAEMVCEDRLDYIRKCCRGLLSFTDLEILLDNIIKRNPKWRITCVLSDLEDCVYYYIPKKQISMTEFEKVYNIYKNDINPQMCAEIIDTQEGPMKFPTQEYRKKYSYVFDLLEENKFELNSDETIIDI